MYVATSIRPSFSKHALSAVIVMTLVPPTLTPRSSARYCFSFMGLHTMSLASQWNDCPVLAVDQADGCRAQAGQGLVFDSDQPVRRDRRIRNAAVRSTCHHA